MAHPNEDLVREGFAAFGRGDMDALRKQFFTDHVRWHNPGHSPISGDYEGTEQVLQYFARVVGLTDGTFSLERHDVLANDEHVVALVTVRGERAGRQLTDNECRHFCSALIADRLLPGLCQRCAVARRKSIAVAGYAHYCSQAGDRG